MNPTDKLALVVIVSLPFALVALVTFCTPSYLALALN